MKNKVSVIDCIRHFWAPIATFVGDISYFLKENRPKILTYGGVVTLVVWFFYMLYFRLFQVKPFGVESHWSMGTALLVYLPTAFVVLRAVYFFGSRNSPMKNSKLEWLYDISRWLYIAFKNFILSLLILVIFLGVPQLKFYQMRVVEGSGFDNISSQQQRSIIRILMNVSQPDTYDSIPSENVDVFSVLPDLNSDTSRSDSDSSSSSSSSNSDNLDWLGQLGLFILAIVAIFASLAYYGLILYLTVRFANFWLVAVPCIAIGMITLGFIDVEDGPDQ
jgi:hypothetical protein